MTTLRRQVKNMVKNYSEAEVKVREATSNDPWGPSSTLMSEISDLTYNIVALGEVMRMIWKRLNDHGKNWRHVYKSLVLLDYLIKNGNEKVAQQCKEHIVAIQTLKDFQHMEEQKDQGASVREKAKQLVNLLRDDERLKAERAKAFKARERFAQNAMGISSDNKMVYANRHLSSSGSGRAPNASYADPYGGAGAASAAAALGAEGAVRGDPSLSPDLEAVRPSDANEEDLQIKLAIMLSQQEHEEEVQRKRADDAKLQIALEQSKTEGQPNGLVDISDDPWGDVNTNGPSNGLFSQSNNHSNAHTISNKTPDAFLNDPWASQPNSASSTEHHDPWKIAPPPSSSSSSNPITTNPWQANAKQQPSNTDPWLTNTPPTTTQNKLDDFELFSSNRTTATKQAPAPGTNDDPFGDFFGATPAAATKPSTNPWNDTSNPKQPTHDLDPFANPSESFQSQPAPGKSQQQPAVTNPIRKTPESFLGENSSLVNLDNLISARPKSTNPFGSAITQPSQMTSSNSFGQLNNPFASQQAASQKQPTINQLQQQSLFSTQLGQPSLTPTPNLVMGGQLAQPLIVPPASSTALFPANTAPTSNLFPQLTPYSGLPNFPALNNPPTTNGAAAAASTNPFLMM